MADVSLRGLVTRASLLLLAALTTACTTGPMDVEEVSYLAVTNGQDTNYFRLKVKASTRLGVAKFQHGWYPASAVDALFGSVGEDGEGKALLMREKLRTQLDESIVEAQKQYLAGALNPNTTEAQMRPLRRAMVRVRQAPRDVQPAGKGMQTIQYNPGKGLVVYKSDEKLVWVLASNPDDVIGAIANFSEQETTQKDILKFTEVVIQGRRNDITSRRATNGVRRDDDALVAQQIDDAQKAITPGAGKAVILEQVEALAQLLRALQRGGE